MCLASGFAKLRITAARADTRFSSTVAMSISLISYKIALHRDNVKSIDLAAAPSKGGGRDNTRVAHLHAVSADVRSMNPATPYGTSPTRKAARTHPTPNPHTPSSNSPTRAHLTTASIPP